MDTGIGLKSENLERIFKPFEQADNSASRKYQGTGLGLSLVKRMVELHGGRIWAESEGEGQGSRFSFILPISVQRMKKGNQATRLLIINVYILFEIWRNYEFTRGVLPNNRFAGHTQTGMDRDRFRRGLPNHFIPAGRSYPPGQDLGTRNRTGYGAVPSI